MQVSLVKVLFALCLCLVIGAICYGVAAVAAGISPRKGNRRRMAAILLGSAMSVASLAIFFAQTQFPVSQAEGVISFVQVQSEGKGYRTDVLLQTGTGTLAVFAHGRSSLFRLGEHVVVDYQEHTGLITKALFIAIDGGGEGKFNSTDSWVPVGGVIIGLYIIWTAFKVHERDPQGAEESRGLNKVPLDSVDVDSLLHLSENHEDRLRDPPLKT
jgi:hypothetical protein